MYKLTRYAVRLRLGTRPVPRPSWIRYASVATAPKPARPPTRSDSEPVPPPPKPSGGIVLRPYQEDAIQAVLDNLKEGKKRLGLSLATGAGKTVIFTRLIDRVPPPTPDATRTLILVHRRELVEQAARHCALAYPEKTIDIEMANSHATGFADITVASVQSIKSMDRILKFDPAKYKLVLVDEAHHIVAGQYLQVLDHFGLRNSEQQSTAVLVGVSATFSRFDGKSLGTAIDHIVYHKDYIDMIKEGWLADIIFTTVESKADLSQVKRFRGDFATGDLSKAVNTEQTNELTVRSWRAKAEGRKATLVFCVDLEHVASLTRTFRRHGVEAHFVTSATPRKIRAERLDAFRNGEYPVLINCGVYTEGTDIPNIDCVVLARPTRSRNLLVQMIGRGVRLHPAKKNCHVIDMVASLETGIVTTPTLFGLDPDEIVENASVKDLEELNEKRKEEEKVREDLVDSLLRSGGGRMIPSTVSFTDYASIEDLLMDQTDERHVRALSRYAWVRVSTDKYVLNNRSGNYLTLEREATGTDYWQLKYVAKLFTAAMMASRSSSSSSSSSPGKAGTGKRKPAAAPPSPYTKPRVLGRFESFEHSVRAGDTQAKEVFEHAFISRGAKWRLEPATPTQLAFLNRGKTPDDEGYWQDGDLTRGMAADMITKLRHGAKGRWTRLLMQKSRLEKARAKEMMVEEMRERERVKVGPLAE